MQAIDSPAILVARFLKANHYEHTLDAFISEAGLPPDAGSMAKGDLTLERVLEEKKIFDLSLSFEKTLAGDGERGWSLPAPAFPTIVHTLPSATNLLHVSIEAFRSRAPWAPSHIIFAATADRCLNLLSVDQNFELLRSINHIHDSPILSVVPYGSDGMMTVSTSMSGQVALYDHSLDTAIDIRVDHRKYVVKVVTFTSKDVIWVATAGWDAKIFLYRTAANRATGLGTPAAYVTLPTNPETLMFLSHPDSGLPILLITRRDSTSLHYFALPSDNDVDQASSTSPSELKFLGKQNLAPHSNSWIAFSPSSVAVCPTDSNLLAVATSAVPHMKLIFVKVLFPSLAPSTILANQSDPLVNQVRAQLAVKDEEDAAVRVHVSTLAPQTPYSTPSVVWRPDGTGVWVNGDDGVLRGIEAKTGNITATLRSGHEAGSKIRSIWSGMVDVDGAGQQEYLISGGFDHRLVVWKPTFATAP